MVSRVEVRSLDQYDVVRGQRKGDIYVLQVRRTVVLHMCGCVLDGAESHMRYEKLTVCESFRQTRKLYFFRALHSTKDGHIQ